MTSGDPEPAAASTDLSKRPTSAILPLLLQQDPPPARANVLGSVSPRPHFLRWDMTPLPLFYILPPTTSLLPDFKHFQVSPIKQLQHLSDTSPPSNSAVSMAGTVSLGHPRMSGDRYVCHNLRVLMTSRVELRNTDKHPTIHRNSPPVPKNYPLQKSTVPRSRLDSNYSPGSHLLPLSPAFSHTPLTCQHCTRTLAPSPC